MSQIILPTGLWKNLKQLEVEAQGEAQRNIKKVLKVKIGY